MAGSNASRARVDFRTTRETKSLIERAAAILGMTVTEFAKASLVERSNEVIRRSSARLLSDRDREAFLALLDEPGSPNAALVAAAAEFGAAVARGDIAP